VTRQVVSVGALQSTEKRTFSLSVEMLPPQTGATNGNRGPAVNVNPPPAAAGGNRTPGGASPPLGQKR
jgi:hypothetical protein